MPEKFAAAFFNIHVEALRFLQVPVIDPGCDDAQAAQLSPVFMGDQIIRIVEAQADLRKRTLRLTRKNLARHHAILAIRHFGGRPQHLVQVVSR